MPITKVCRCPELSRSSTHHDDTPICGAIPAVHQVALATPECPDREVEPERRHWTQHERERCLTVTHYGDSAERSPGRVCRNHSSGLCRPRLRSQVLLQGDRIVVLGVV